MKSLRYPRPLVAVWDMCWWPRRQLMEARHNQVSLAALYTSNVLVDRGHQKGPTLSHCKTQTKPSLVGISQCVIKRRCRKKRYIYGQADHEGSYSFYTGKLWIKGIHWHIKILEILQAVTILVMSWHHFSPPSHHQNLIVSKTKRGWNAALIINCFTPQGNHCHLGQSCEHILYKNEVHTTTLRSVKLS